MIDGCFTVRSQRWGTYDSFTLDGKPILTSLTEEVCIQSTRAYLKMRQDGFTSDAPTYAGRVDGKL